MTSQGSFVEMVAVAEGDLHQSHPSHLKTDAQILQVELLSQYLWRKIKTRKLLMTSDQCLQNTYHLLYQHQWILNHVTKPHHSPFKVWDFALVGGEDRTIVLNFQVSPFIRQCVTNWGVGRGKWSGLPAGGQIILVSGYEEESQRQEEMHKKELTSIAWYKGNILNSGQYRIMIISTERTICLVSKKYI